MPIIAYVCECKHLEKKFFRSPGDAPSSLTCAKCGLVSKKALSAPNSTSTVVIDNGFQARAVEVNPEIVAINKERSEKNYREE